MTHRSRFWRLFFRIVLILIGGSGPAAADSVTVVDADEGVATGRLLNFEGSKLSIEDRKIHEFATANLTTLRYDDHKAEDASSGSLVLLDNGDRLHVRPVKVDEDQIEARWAEFPDGRSVLIPLETVRGIVFKVPKLISERNQLIKNLLNDRRNSDELILLNGDRIPIAVLRDCCTTFENIALKDPSTTTTRFFRALRRRFLRRSSSSAIWIAASSRASVPFMPTG